VNVQIAKTEKQREAIDLISECETSLLEGGSRSGKTFIILYAILIRAISTPGDHLVCRFRFAHAKQAICLQTMPKLLRILHLTGLVRLNKSDWLYELPNGSKIWVGGLDDKERTEKILGLEYATIFLNEASQISFDSYEMIVSRLNPPRGLRGKIIIDYNPPSTVHWGYKIFHKREFPDGHSVPENNFKFMTMNPADNLANIDPEYLKRLEFLSAEKRNRFLYGQYSTDSGSLWKRAWINYQEPLPDMDRVVIGVDPAGTVGGDEVGIIVCGQSGDMFYVLDDYSLHGTPAQWAAEVAAAYEKWQADVVVAEKNYGGDMVAHTIQTARPLINVKLITSSRGKILRAEPISALYEHGKVKHRIRFLELEDEYCIYSPDADFSPNRMDAAVFALSELSGEGPSMLDVVG
jgi:hypothetical protein